MQTPQPFGEVVCRIWGGNGSVRRCVLKGESKELAIDVVEVRVIPQQFLDGVRHPAHGTLSIDVRSDQARDALKQLARSLRRWPAFVRSTSSPASTKRRPTRSPPPYFRTRRWCSRSPA